MKLTPISQPLTMFLIGATGDLAKRKILRAIYELSRQDLLPQPFHLIAVARQQMTTGEYVEFVRQAVQPVLPVGETGNQTVWNRLAKSITYVSGDVTEITTFEKIKAVHEKLNACGNHLWYAATLPSLYVDVARHIGQVGLNRSECGWTKIMMEKPFGTDLASAQELDRFLLTIFKEDQIYRIDHFLAKETVQNLLAFRFANGIFEHLWDRHHVDQIQVHSTETAGLSGRGEFYEGVGTVRDVVQNHVLQLIAMTMMEEPSDLTAASINRQRNELLKTLRIYGLNGELARVSRFGQYGVGVVDGQRVPAYPKEARLPVRESRTETAVALALESDSERWKGVPIFIRAGKRLAQTATEISIQFKEQQNNMFTTSAQQPNVLTLRIQPNEGVVVRLLVKRPGLSLEVEEVPMQFCYKNEFQMDLVEAYVKLIYDAIGGDSSLFPDSQGIEAAWRVVEPILDYKRSPAFRLEQYPAGSWGPKSFDDIPALTGKRWIEPSAVFCNFVPSAPTMHKVMRRSTDEIATTQQDR